MVSMILLNPYHAKNIRENYNLNAFKSQKEVSSKMFEKGQWYGALSPSLSILGGSPMLQAKINYTELTMPYFC